MGLGSVAQWAMAISLLFVVRGHQMIQLDGDPNNLAGPDFRIDQKGVSLDSSTQTVGLSIRKQSNAANQWLLQSITNHFKNPRIRNN